MEPRRTFDLINSIRSACLGAADPGDPVRPTPPLGHRPGHHCASLITCCEGTICIISVPAGGPIQETDSSAPPGARRRASSPSSPAHSCFLTSLSGQTEKCKMQTKESGKTTVCCFKGVRESCLSVIAWQPLALQVCEFKEPL